RRAGVRVAEVGGVGARRTARTGHAGRDRRGTTRPQHPLLGRARTGRRRAVEGRRVLADVPARTGVAVVVPPRLDGPPGRGQNMAPQRRLLLFAVSLVIAGVALALASARNPNLWSSPDRRADRLLHDGKFEDAARAYRDPYRRGVALYRG